MNPDQVNQITDSLLSEARAASAPVRAATVRRVNAFDRFITGLVTLIGAYLGWRLAGSWFGHAFPPGLFGAFTGLFAAVAFPRRRQA